MPSPGARLLAHVMLAEVAASNNFTKLAEEKKLTAMVALLPLFDPLWSPNLSPSGDQHLVHEVTKHDGLLHIVAKVVLCTLGTEAAQALVLLESLIHSKVDFLVHCSAWLWP